MSASAIELWLIEASDSGHVQDIRGLLCLAAASETICDGARRIADVVLWENEVHSVFGQAIRESNELSMTVEIEAGSRVIGKTLSELKLEEGLGMTVMTMAIRRPGTITRR